MIENFGIKLDTYILEGLLDLVNEVIFLLIHQFDYLLPFIQYIHRICCLCTEQMKLRFEVISLKYFNLLVRLFFPLVVFFKCLAVNFH